MSNVTVTIGGRDYSLACAEGEEEHVRAMAGMIAAKVDGMRGSVHGETRQLLFAALLLADELHDARSRQTAGDPDSHAPALEALASRLENIAAALEG